MRGGGVRRAILVITLAAGMLAGCMRQSTGASPVEVRYLELPVSDMARAVAFYEHVFEVRLEQLQVDGYDMARFPSLGDRVGADVALAKGDVYVPSKAGPIVYFHVASIDRVMERATQRGAKVLYPKKSIGDAGFVAEFEDSEGNRIALSQSLP